MQLISQQLVFSAEVVDVEGKPLPTVTHRKTTYVVGHPGDNFHIRARVRFRNSSTLARPNKPQFKVYLKVDGPSVGYTKLCYVADNITGVKSELSESVLFRGRGNGDHQKSLFTFAQLETRCRDQPGMRMLPAAESEMGAILVRFREVESSGASPGGLGSNPSQNDSRNPHNHHQGLSSNPSGLSSLEGGFAAGENISEGSLAKDVPAGCKETSDEANRHGAVSFSGGGSLAAQSGGGTACRNDNLVLDEDDVKHYMKPSLRAADGQLAISTGQKVRGEVKGAEQRQYRAVDLTCRFETADVLKLRGILSLDNPAHRVICETALAKLRLPALTRNQTHPPASQTPFAYPSPNRTEGPVPSNQAAASTRSVPSETGTDLPRLSRGGASAAEADPLPGDIPNVLCNPGQEPGLGLREQEDCGRICRNRTVSEPPTSAGSNDVRTEEAALRVATTSKGTGAGDSVNAPPDRGNEGDPSEKAPVNTGLSSVSGRVHTVGLEPSHTVPAAQQHPRREVSLPIRNGSEAHTGLRPPETDSQAARPSSEGGGYGSLTQATTVDRVTRGRLAQACKEGRSPLSLSMLKKREAEKGGIYIERRKRAALAPREVVRIDLTVDVEGLNGDDGAYVTTIEKMPVPGVVPVD